MPRRSTVQLNCGPGQLYAVAVPANGSATQDGIPVGSQCTATESARSDGLVDASYAWASPSFDPADATVTVALDAPQTITVTNPILRVTAPVQLVKQFSGAPGCRRSGLRLPDQLVLFIWRRRRSER